MVKWIAAVALCCSAGSAVAATASTERQRQACQMFGEATDGMGAAIQRQKEVHSSRSLGSLASDLPADAANAAKKSQQAAEAVVYSLQVLQENIEDLNYLLKLCGRSK